MEFKGSEDDFSWTKISGVKGNEITVLGRVESNSKYSYVYYYHCSTCSSDKELFPVGSLKTKKSNLRKGEVNCGCGVKTLWSEYQYNVRCKRKAEGLGFIFLGFCGKSKGNKSGVRLYNPNNEVCWVVASVDSFLHRGSKCPVEYKKSVVSMMSRSDEDHIKDFLSTGKFHKDCVFKRNGDKWKRNSRGGRDYVYWDVICPVCKNDEYSKIKDVFTTHISGLKKGQTPCRCSNSYNWSEEENYRRIQIKAEGMGYKFLGWASEYKGDKTYLRLETMDGEVWETTSITNLLQGRGNRPERLKAGGKKTRKSLDYYLEKLKLVDGSSIERYEHDDGRMSKRVKFKCGVCSKDKYVKNNLCSGEWDTDLNSLVKGGRPCRCTKPYYWTYEQREFDLREILEHEGCSFIKWVFKPKDLVSHSKFSWKCSKGTENVSLTDNFLNGSRCTCCNSYGFDKTKSGYIYLCRWYGFGEEFLKIGITNRRYMDRIKEQYKKSKLDFELLSVYTFEDGSRLFDTEKLLISRFKVVEDCCPKEWLPDGYTETFTVREEIIETYHETCKDFVKIK